MSVVSAFGFARADPFGDYKDLGIQLSNNSSYTQLEESAQQESIVVYKREVELWSADMTASRLKVHDYAKISAWHHGLTGDKANWYAYKLLQNLAGLIEENGGTVL